MATEARPAQPKSILRGHKAQVHAAAFVRGNERLLTGDADGFVVAWDLTTMRPRAVWQAHDKAILGLAGWGPERLITHGRDNKLVVWKLASADESRLSTSLPLDPAPQARPQPWILYMLEVNTMNFCSFSHCPLSPSETLVAVPNTLASEAIDIFHLPSQSRRHTVKLGEKNGMVMALSLFRQDQSLTLVAGYENGMAIVAQHASGGHGDWITKYQAKCHSQPVLSLDVSPGRDYFLTSSADAVIAKHPLPLLPPHEQTPDEIHHPSRDTQLGGQTNLITASAPIKSLLSAALATSEASPPASTTTTTTTTQPPRTPARSETIIQTEPLKTVNTRHSGQQSLHIRSDGRVFATAGWDSRVRVYSARTLSEVAVLKWHQVGCYAAAFAEVVGQPVQEQEQEEGGEEEEGGAGSSSSADVGDTQGGGGGAAESPKMPGEDGDSDGASLVTVPKLVELSVRDKRVRQARTAHWLAAGSKDGKLSLWDVF